MNGRPFLFHSRGQVDAIMEDLIETVGIDARHSFQDNIEPVEEVIDAWPCWRADRPELRQLAVTSGRRAPSYPFGRRSPGILESTASFREAPFHVGLSPMRAENLW
jgi:hypothetical protein